jgi:hypothetical protein
VRGGLDDALDKLARRDRLRRRAAGETTGTPLPVQELVEAIAAVVGRNPKLEVTVGVEGAGDPTLLHFFVEDGTVQVNADSSVASRVTEATPTSPRHADFDAEVEEPAEEPYVVPAAYAPSGAYATERETGESTRWIGYDDRDRYDPGTGYGVTGYANPEAYTDPDDRPYDGQRRYEEPRTNGAAHASRESSFPTADSAAGEYPFLHSFAATPPPPVPPQTARRIRPEHHRAPEEPSAAERSAGRTTEPPIPGPRPAEAQRGMPTPLPEPIPLRVDSEETEMAAKRLAALLRDNPTLLRRSPLD